MEYISHSFRHAEVMLNQAEFIAQYQEMKNVIESVTDQDIIERHVSYTNPDGTGVQKSISTAINALPKDRFIETGWDAESAIFQDNSYNDDTWRLDFAKGDICIEVAFDHGEAIAWNLIKPVLGL